MKKKNIIIGSIIVALVVTGIGGYVAYQNHVKEVAAEKARIKKHAINSFEDLFSDEKQEVIKVEVTQKDVDTTKASFKTVEDKIKKPYLKRLNNIERFIIVRDDLQGYIVEGVMKSDISDEKIAELQKACESLEPLFQPLLKESMDVLIAQRTEIKGVAELAATFLIDGVVHENIDAETFTSLKNRIDNLPQRDIADSYTSTIEQIQAKFNELEERERLRLEAERQAAIQRALEESERIRKENEAIAAANVMLANVPLIDQRNGVLNGCEVAALLMGMQYKGYHQGMTLHQIAEAVPKTDDPYTGFVLDIWGSLPNNKPHWIAPSALASFGQTYYPGVIDITGSSVDQLKAEIDAGNPVIIYATYGFYNPTGWYQGVPINQHVMLLIGYNAKTGSMIINDPWGGVQINIAKDRFAQMYGLKTFAVAIR